jgi:hypothetical protein
MCGTMGFGTSDFMFRREESVSEMVNEVKYLQYLSEVVSRRGGDGQ